MSLNPIVNLSISYLALFLSLFFCKGDFWISATVLFTIYGFYLTLILMLAILVELLFANKKIENNDTEIKKAIQRLAEEYKEKALDEQTLLDKLKSEVFPNEQEIISRTKTQELVAEMDYESAINEPKITIFEYDKIIPRWKKEYDEILNKTNLIIFIKDKENSFWTDYTDIITEKEIDNVCNIISNKVKLSKELLIENNYISRYYFVKGKIEYKVVQTRANGTTYFIDKTIYCLFFKIDNDTLNEGKVISLNTGKYLRYDYRYNYTTKEKLENYSVEIIWKRRLNEMRIIK